MKSITCSEVFYSIQGEGRRVGTPSIFIRTFGCTLRCPGFGSTIKNPVFPIHDEDVPRIEAIEDIPVPDVGCDSYPSWDRRFLHLHKRYSVDSLLAKVREVNKASVISPDIVFTGGEPLLRGNQDFFIRFLTVVQSFTNIRNITFETNGTVPLTEKFYDFLAGTYLSVTFSISPKLSNSGESVDAALNTEAVAAYVNSYTQEKRCDSYLKFVIRDKSQMEEVEKFKNTYNVEIDTYLMPEGGTSYSLSITTEEVVNLCLRSGYTYSPRLHVDLFGNHWGT